MSESPQCNFIPQCHFLLTVHCPGCIFYLALFFDILTSNSSRVMARAENPVSLAVPIRAFNAPFFTASCLIYVHQIHLQQKSCCAAPLRTTQCHSPLCFIRSILFIYFYQIYSRAVPRAQSSRLSVYLIRSPNAPPPPIFYLPFLI